MKIYILTVTLLFAVASACTTTPGTPANNGVSNSNSPANDKVAGVKPEKSPAANEEKKTNNTTTKTEKPADSTQPPERVQFAAGKTETDLTRTIPANGSIDFVLNAQSGQRMQYSVIYDKGSDTDIEVFLTEPGLQDIAKSSAANEPNEFMVKKTGDHRITVNNTTGNKISVRFGLSIK